MSRSDDDYSGSGFLGLVGVGVVAVGLLTLGLGSWYTVDQTKRAVLLRNGAYVETVQPGLHFKLPWVDSVYKIDMQTHTHSWKKMESYSADQQPANLLVSVTLRVSPDKVGEVYSRFGGDLDAAITRLISPHVNREVKTVFGQYTAARAISQRGALNIDVAKALNESLAIDPVFLVESVQVEDIVFSPEYIKSVEQRMQAEVEVQRLRQNLEREKVQAEIVVTQATAQANATVANAKAAAESVRLRGDAEASAITARAKALGDNPNLVTLTQAERWDGKLPTTMVPSGALPMITMGK